MNPEPDHQAYATQIPAPQSRSFWKKLGGGSLSISLLIHGILLMIGVIWVIKIVQPVEKSVEFLPKSGGGGSPSSESLSRKQQVKMVKTNLARVSALGAVSTMVLPEPDEMTRMTSMGPINSGGISGGIGGPGSGGGRGNGNGPGFGDGMALGNNNGTGSKNPFGMPDMKTGGLAGTFYDFKQTKNLKPTGLTDNGVRDELKEIVKRGLKERDFSKFYKAPSTLYQTKFMIPRMSAELAPAAFDVEKYVQPRRWAVVYRGSVTAPKSGTFRFVGAGDDVLVVQLNNRLVFDYGYTLAATGGNVAVPSAANYEKDKKSDAIRNFKRLSTMPVPTINYKYTTTPTINSALGGVAAGPEFKIEAGRSYPIEILISEIPGGLFSAALMIEEIGATYQKDSGGSPILPLFRLDHSVPDPDMKGEAPPTDPNGPVWKSADRGSPLDI